MGSIEEVERLMDAAGPGPWRYIAEAGFRSGPEFLSPRVVDSRGNFVCKVAWQKDWDNSVSNLEVISRAPSIIYWLIKEIKSLRADLEASRRMG